MLLNGREDTEKKSRRDLFSSMLKRQPRSLRKILYSSDFPENKPYIAYKDGGTLKKYGLPVSGTALTCIWSRKQSSPLFHLMEALTKESLTSMRNLSVRGCAPSADSVNF